jgi:alpha-L-rhamnosidase
MLANGATTSWEGWTGQSHIHDTLISIGAWFIEGVGGIRADERAPGFEHFFVRPAVVGDLTSARASYRSIRGDIVSDWRIENGFFHLRVTVPPGTTATVVVPGEGPVRTVAWRSPSITAGDTRRFDVAAGTHSFEARLREAGNRRYDGLDQ